MKHVKSRAFPAQEGLTKAQNHGREPATAAPASGSKDAGVTSGGELTKPPVSGIIKKSKSLARRYSDLQLAYWRLQRQFNQLKSPSLSQEQIEDQLASIRRWFAKLSNAEGAVTAANLYGKEFWTDDLDSKYKVALLTWLLEKFSHEEPLIVAAYNLWTRLLEKEGHKA